MKNFYVLILLFSFFHGLHAQHFDWAKVEGMWAYDYGYDLAIDSAGNVYLAGKYELSANFSGTTLPCQGNHDSFLAKYNSDGNLSWIRTSGGRLGDYATTIACDGTHYVYTAGEIEGYSDTIYFPGSSITLIADGNNDLFLAKYTLVGTLIWAKQGGWYKDEKALGIDMDSQGNVFICGYFKDTTKFDGPAIYGHGKQDILIAKYDSSGNLMWVKTAGSKNRDEAKAIKCDAQGNIYVCGMFSDTVDFGNQTLVSPNGYYDAFVAKYNTNGDLLWVQKGSSDYDEVAWDLTLDNDANVYISGEFNAYAHFGSYALTTSGNADVFVAAYDSSGNVLWAKGAGGNLIDRVRGMSCYNSELYLTGQFGDTASFDSETIVASDTSDIFIVKLTTGGNFVWATSVGGSPDNYESLGYESGNTIGADAYGHVFVSGAMLDGGQFGDTTINDYARTDVFLTRISQIDSIAPYTVSYFPSDNSFNIGKAENLVMTFNEPIQPGSGDISIYENGTLKHVLGVVSSCVIFTGNKVTINVPSDFTDSAEIYVEMPLGCILDYSGNYFSGINDTITWNFKVEDALTFVSTIPANMNFTIYPNPTQGRLYVSLEGTMKKESMLTIYDITGRVLDKKKLQGATSAVDLNNYPKGVYLFEVQSGEKKITRKIILN